MSDDIAIWETELAAEPGIYLAAAARDLDAASTPTEIMVARAALRRAAFRWAEAYNRTNEEETEDE